MTDHRHKALETAALALHTPASEHTPDVLGSR